MKTFINLTALIALAVAGAWAGNRPTSIAITFDDPDQTGVAGQTLQFFGTITNTGPTSAYLNSDTVNLALGASDYTLTDHFSTSLGPLGVGQSTADVDLFDITLAAPDPGLYAGLYSVLAGSNPQDNSAPAQAPFSVTVTVVAPPVGLPEEGAWPLIAAMIGLALIWRSRFVLAAVASRR